MNGQAGGWVLTRSGDSQVAFRSEWVAEITLLTDLNAMPGTPHYIQGLMLLRDQSVLVVDLRAWLGMRSARDELEDTLAMLAEREQEHRRWLLELEASVRENRRFELETDPHRCAFGRWYDRYAAPTLALATHLWKFRAPHDRIHALALEVTTLVGQGEREKALQIIEQVRGTTLAAMIELFGEARHLFRTGGRQVVVVLRSERGRLGLTVDEVQSVEAFDEGAFESLPAELGAANTFVRATTRLAGERGIALIPDDRALVEQFAGWM